MSNYTIPARGIRAYSFVCYLNDKTAMLQALGSINDLQKFAFCIHDRDESEPHTHCLIVTANTHSVSSIKKRFVNGTTATTVMIEPLVSPQGMFKYLTHEDEPDKVTYSVDEIITNDSDYFATAEQLNDICVDIVESMIAGVSKRELVHLYGKHFVYNYRNFLYLVNDIKSEERNKSNLYEVAQIETCQ